MTFEDAFCAAPGDGWLTEAEARLLWDALNQTAGPDGVSRAILEVGCYKGRSTVLLASSGRPVYSVDPFAGFTPEDPTGDGIRRDFLDNLEHRGVRNVKLFVQRIEDWLPLPVGFAYLDGDHTYAGTKGQIGKALQCDPKGLAVHDVSDSGGGAEVKRACLELLGPWDERVERLAVWRML